MTKDRKKARAIVRFPATVNKINCMIVDVSLTGARIHIAVADQLPSKFDISIHVLPETPPLLLKAKKVWRKNELAGLHFEALSRKDSIIINALVRIHRAEVIQTM